MSILKLLPGQKIHLTVVTTSLVEGNYGPQIKFSGFTADDNDAAIFLNVDTAEQQLARIGLTVETAKGQQVEIERIEKNGRKFTNINRVGASSASAPVAASAATRQPVGSLAKAGFSAGPHIPGMDDGSDALPHEKLNRLFNIYGACMDHALLVAKKMDAAQIGSSPESTAAIAATLLIAAQRAGV